ncbi:RmlC-like cupin [Amniculicola lignicola CBS 123094]|uniref:RmlC-like cupin n=1 Tax=Amniculicola lignicola CBS 123094 TaxID=1392246 RepID=A0A6A5WJ95_9PLEO|nr:RmlC-like cupin [Amniculicola lignicola CBS 123094]
MAGKNIRPVVLGAQNIANRPQEGFEDTTGGNVTWKTLLSAPKTATDTFTSGIASCKPKGGHLNLHRHKHAEIYHIIQGQGIVPIDRIEYKVEKGSVLYIPGDAEHGIRNTSSEEELIWLYVFATDSFTDVVYRFKEEDSAPRSKL